MKSVLSAMKRPAAAGATLRAVSRAIGERGAHAQQASTLRRSFVVLAACLLLAACGNSDRAAPVVPPPPPPPPPPPAATASFTAPATVDANAVAAFDASASTASDGSALQYFWDFGDGARGGGRQIAHVYATGGSRTVTLTVIDGARLSATATRSLTVNAPPAASATRAVQIEVKDQADAALAGVAITAVGGTATATTAADGKASLTLGLGVPVVLKFAKTGYADRILPVNLPTTAGADAYLQTTLRPRDASVVLADAAAGGTLTGRDGATLTLPASALVTASGTAVTGAVDVSLTAVDPTQPGGGGFPGEFGGVSSTGSVTPIVSYGTVEFVLRAGNQSVALAPGKTATIALPLYAVINADGSTVVAGDRKPLWSLDESTGLWIQEGEGTVVAASDSPSGLSLQATVSHLSWWNTDLGFDPYGPKPKCVYDTNIGIPGAQDTFATATICNMLAAFDRPRTAAGATGRARAQAVTLTPRIVGYSRTTTIPIAGAQDPLPVPAGVNIALTGTALNGTWSGRKIVNGAVGVIAQELIPLRPIATTGPTLEPITIPFDATRALDAGQLARFGFGAQRLQYVRITAQPGTGSTLAGTVRLLSGTSVLGSVNFGPGQTRQILQLLNSAGPFEVQVENTDPATGSFRLQVELLGGPRTEAIAYPFSVDTSLTAFTPYRGTFQIDAPQSGLLVFDSPVAVARARIVGSDGTQLTSLTGNLSAPSTALATFAAAGSYALEVATDDGSARPFKASGERTQWLPVATELPIDSVFGVFEFLRDRTGAPVLGYYQPFVANGVDTARVLLRRWSGSAWEAVGPDLLFDRPCSGSNPPVITVAFDADNAPLVAYGAVVAGTSGATFTAAQRLRNGAWVGVGASDGKLPNASNFGGSCQKQPALAFDAGGAPLIAYQAESLVYLQRFDGTNWGPITSAAADTFDGSNRTFELTVSPDARLYFTLASGFNTVGTVVRRLQTGATPSWEILGPNGGVLPESGSCGLSFPQLEFDGANQPIVGFTAAIGTCGTASSAAEIFRYDGSTWTTGGAFKADTSSRVGNSFVTLAQFGGETYAAWTNTNSTVANAPVVQKNTAAGWSPVGPGIGLIPQFASRGLLTGASGYVPRLLAVGPELYLVLVAPTGATSGGSPLQTVRLLRRVE